MSKKHGYHPKAQLLEDLRIKKYICPNCKEPFTKLKRRTVSIGDIFIGLFYILFGGLIGSVFLFVAIFLMNEEELWVRIVFGLASLFSGFLIYVGLLHLHPTRWFCPNCDIRLKRKGSLYIAPFGIKGMRSPSPELERLVDWASDNSVMGKIARKMLSSIPESERAHLLSSVKREREKTHVVGEHSTLYICPACSSPIVKTIQKKNIDTIIRGTLFFIVGLVLVLVPFVFPEQFSEGGVKNELGILSGEIVSYLIFLLSGAVFGLPGLYWLLHIDEIELCPICKARIEKFRGVYRVVVKKPSGSSIVG